MSRAHVRHLSDSGAQRGLDELLSALPKLASRSIEQYAELLQRGSALVSGMLPKQLLSMAGCCDIPEQDCPPRCVCAITWEAAPGESVHATIRVTNTSAQARAFHFKATALQGGPTPPALDISPASANLASGQSVTLTLATSVGANAKPGESYSGEVLINGAYEQCVIVRLDVCSNQSAHCEVEQGDAPVRVRAHQWYHHFQCEEPCAPARSPRQPGGTVPGAPVSNA